MADPIEDIKISLAPLRKQLVEHEVFRSMHTIEDVRVFMEHHVFAVWDFMSLLKALQRDLTCVTVPWVPRGNPNTRRLINEMVLEEETELDIEENPASFFELYLRGMERAEANTSPVRKLWEMIVFGKSVDEALDALDIPDSIKDFVRQTFSVINDGKAHEIAAALTLGREDLIPGMFRQMIKDLKMRFPELLGVYTYYIEKHVKMYKEVHTPLAMQMIRQLCGSDLQKWQDCERVAANCMKARIRLWDGVMVAISSSPHQLENY
ncbi:MAG: DUF3050 domain-containing protein [Hymenobacteraceae bacterium]|nr:DUF3050 domain-containing protein [Hymenobacteraceae bacterium]MDX5394820.1 DUF3050 domain-containing protein [Hymenobacteraceae bacterium]MDX5443119.1 DUF3050 domain-containing protein [Hymenobacteraceae bacterium]MDX5510854.1 DUF3050 domain-containing protein [Hymenobacteraceae bacterium]